MPALRSRLRRIGSFFSISLCLLVLVLSACEQERDPSCKECSLGQQKCAADFKGILLCKQIITTGCYQYTLQRCNPGLVCTTSTTGNQYSCQVEGQNCLTKCTTGQKRCEGETITECKIEAASGCPQWLPERTCGPGKPCKDGVCQGEPAPCTPTNPQHEKRCEGTDLYYYDDCGTKGTIAEQCLETCEAGACKKKDPPGPCTPTITEHAKKCEGKVVYWYDDCDTKGALVETCPDICKEGKCEGNSGCKPTDTMYQKKCEGNTVFWYDDCGGKRDLIEACPPSKKCQNGVCDEPGCTGGTNECALSDSRCSGTTMVQSCDKNPTNGCFVWGPTTPCGVGTICSGGQCIRDPSGGGTCNATKSLGQCRDDLECCKNQTCQKVLFGLLNHCGPCSSNADCPTANGGAQLTCCPGSGSSYCALLCTP